MVSEAIHPKTDAARRDRPLLAPGVAAALLTAFIALFGWWLAHGTITSHFVRVHWQPNASAAERSEHTRDLSLHVTEEGMSNGLHTGVYLLADTSRENIARILGDSLIVRADFLDPATLRPTQPYARPIYVSLSIRYPWLPAATLLRPWAIVPAAALCFLLMVAASRRGRQWLVERVPPISPATLGMYRVGFAMALWVTVDRRIDGPELRTVLFTLLVAFALGVAARLMFVGFVFLTTREFYGGAEGHTTWHCRSKRSGC